MLLRWPSDAAARLVTQIPRPASRAWRWTRSGDDLASLDDERGRDGCNPWRSPTHPKFLLSPSPCPSSSPGPGTVVSSTPSSTGTRPKVGTRLAFPAHRSCTSARLAHLASHSSPRSCPPRSQARRAATALPHPPPMRAAATSPPRAREAPRTTTALPPAGPRTTARSPVLGTAPSLEVATTGPAARLPRPPRLAMVPRRGTRHRRPRMEQPRTPDGHRELTQATTSTATPPTVSGIRDSWVHKPGRKPSP